MKKIILNIAGIALTIALILISCTKQDVKPNKASDLTTNTNENNNSSTQSLPIKPTVKGITIQTYNPNLAYFQNMASAYGYTFAVYSGTLTPSKQGIWDYEEVYRYKQGTGDNYEVYEFTDIDAYNYAVGICGFDIWEENNKIHCGGSGNFCTEDLVHSVPVYY